MNKLIGFGVAVALCMAAAGFGAYMAVRQQPAAAAASLSADSGRAAPLTPAPRPAGVTAGDAAAGGSARVPAVPATSSREPLAQMPRAAKPAPPAPAASDAVSGGATPAPPASQALSSGRSVNAGVPPAADTTQTPVPEPVAPEQPRPASESLRRTGGLGRLGDRPADRVHHLQRSREDRGSRGGEGDAGGPRRVGDRHPSGARVSAR